MNRLSSLMRLFLLFILAIIIVLFFYVGIYLPKEEILTTLIEDLNTLEKEIVTLKNQHKDLSSEIVQKQSELPRIPQELLNSAAPTDDIPELLSQWTKEGKKLGIEVLVFKPLEEKTFGQLTEMPIAITLRGTFHQTLSFFNFLSQSDRKILISNIDMSKPEKKENTYVISTHAIATTFRKGTP